MYKGCDLIDLNPGVCLWSQKLHDFLQPRTHVLFEPTPSMWSDYQRPLLDKPGSTYRLFQSDIKDKDAFDGLFRSDILPRQNPVEPQSLEARQPNNNLLVTGSLMWDPKAKGMAYDSLGKQLLVHLTESALTNERYHKYGPVRSLLWMTEEDFKGAVPRSHYMYGKYSFFVNYLAKTVQVVTPRHAPKGPAYSTIGRLPQYEIQSVIRAMQRGQDNGMELPKHRRDCVHEMADEIAQCNIERGKAADARLSTVEMFQYLEKRVRDGKSTVGIDYEQDIRTIKALMNLENNPHLRMCENEKGQLRASAEGRRVTQRKATLKSNRKQRIQAGEVADRLEEIFDWECRILAMKDGPDKEHALQVLETMNENMEAALIDLSSIRRTGAISEANERISLKSPVPRLQWDHRPYEPLVMHEDEVWPMKRACLIDSEPRPFPPGRGANWWSWILDFAYALLQTPNASVKKALDTMQPGASSLCDEVSSLRDPKRGGRLDLDHLKVSMLTNEMITDLHQAYMDWPFRDGSATHSRYFQLKIRGRTNRDS
ncbi:uncharacterized protein N0V89_009744 [Didymosphaeria variabile]|uniref:Mitochondrial transcription factor 1 n=1 Tax=Didymosphaeria variabile TaxID=1932322 RepID=A0A9W8XEB7_9PLEO|nr:uncharacterized protein N0V89_009744 [Didymosphaeria variabile]KAJ4348370.1 hypothetical protein N0V89_009744 [Didymosphaeria variabile]